MHSFTKSAASRAQQAYIAFSKSTEKLAMEMFSNSFDKRLTFYFGHSILITDSK
jgi:hypothetical protein